MRKTVNGIFDKMWTQKPPSVEAFFVLVWISVFATFVGSCMVNFSQSLGGTCGNGRIEDGETCDDRNAVARDGCSETCRIEDGWSCEGEPSSCSVHCGDGLIFGQEICDDGNALSGDGCSQDCNVEDGWVCEGQPSVCVGICGDGQMVGGETCDDWNHVGGDGCSDDCQTENGWSCGGQPSTCSSVCGDAICVGTEPATCSDDCEVIGVTLGFFHSCLLFSGDHIWCWGHNTSGELGDGSMSNRYGPVAVRGLPVERHVAHFTGGGLHTCAALGNGGAWCWGDNGYGQLGDGTTTDRQMPVQVMGLPAGTSVSFVGAGDENTCAALDNGSLWCWGRNDRGQLGDGTNDDSLVPVQVLNIPVGHTITGLATGLYHTCIIMESREVWCWGTNYFGELGDGSTGSQSLAVQVQGLPDDAVVSKIAAGYSFTCALLQDGTVWCWGDNISGTVGDGTTENRSQPTQVVGLDADASRLSAGQNHACVVLQDGTAKCWGANYDGELGDGTTTDRHEPTQVVGFPSGVVLSDIGTGRSHTCAVSRDGRIWCWGENLFGQLGDGTTTDSSSPRLVSFQ